MRRNLRWRVEVIKAEASIGAPFPVKLEKERLTNDERRKRQYIKDVAVLSEGLWTAEVERGSREEGYADWRRRSSGSSGRDGRYIFDHVGDRAGRVPVLIHIRLLGIPR